MYFIIRTFITCSSRVECVTCTMKSWWCIGASSVDTWFWGTLFYCKKGNIHVTRITSINTINVCRKELKNSECDKANIFLLGRHHSLGVLKYWDGRSICPSNITFVWLFFGSNWSIHHFDTGHHCMIELRKETDVLKLLNFGKIGWKCNKNVFFPLTFFTELPRELVRAVTLEPIWSILTSTTVLTGDSFAACLT